MNTPLEILHMGFEVAVPMKTFENVCISMAWIMGEKYQWIYSSKYDYHIPQYFFSETNSLHLYIMIYFIQYMARIWPRYSLRGLIIRVTWFS